MKRIQRLKRVATKFDENVLPSRTDAQYLKECDVNEIVRKFKKTGQINHLAKSRGFYADVSEYPDLLTAHNVSKRAEEAFMSLPASLRKKFRTIQDYLVFIEDPANNQECIELGLKIPVQKSEKEGGQVDKPAAKAKPPKDVKNESKSKDTSSADA